MLFILTILTALLTGCGNDSASQSVPEVGLTPFAEAKPTQQPADEEWKLYTVEEEGFAISLPPGWMEINMSEQDAEEMMGAMVDANPALGSMSRQIASMAAQGIKFYAFDLHSPSLQLGVMSNINVLRMDNLTGVELETIVEQALSPLDYQFAEMNEGLISSTYVTTSSGIEMGRWDALNTTQLLPCQADQL